MEKKYNKNKKYKNKRNNKYNNNYNDKYDDKYNDKYNDKYYDKYYDNPEKTSKYTKKKYYDMKKSKEDIHLSKFLSLILRHKATDFGLDIEPSGFVKLDDIIYLPQCKNFNITLEKIKNIVANDKKGRFELVNRPPYYIRAVQGHSMHEVSNDDSLVKLNKNNIFDFPTVVHGTDKNAWEKIVETGLNKMNRNAIHLSIGYNDENHVKSGMRLNCEIFIEINVQYAFYNNFEFFINKNKVILTPGDENGILPVEYIKKVIDNKKNILYTCVYEIFIKYIQKCFCVYNKKELLFKNEDPNLIGDFLNEKNLFKNKIITIIENKEDEDEYIKLIKNGVENKTIKYVSLFIDYLIDNKENENSEDNDYTSEYIKKVDVDWITFYDNNIYENEEEEKNEENKIEDKKEETDNKEMEVEEESNDNNKINVSNNIINSYINVSKTDDGNVHHEKLTKEIISNKSKLKYYILIFLNYINDDKSTIKSIDVIIFKSSEIKEKKLFHSFRFVFYEMEKTEKKYSKFLNKLKNDLTKIDIIHKRIIVCMTRNDQSFINKELAKYTFKIPKLLMRNIIIINENDFKEFYELNGEDNDLNKDDLNDVYLEAKKIFFDNYIANEERVKSLIII